MTIGKTLEKISDYNIIPASILIGGEFALVTGDFFYQNFKPHENVFEGNLRGYFVRYQEGLPATMSEGFFCAKNSMVLARPDKKITLEDIDEHASIKDTSLQKLEKITIELYPRQANTQDTIHFDYDSFNRLYNDLRGEIRQKKSEIETIIRRD